MNNQNKNGPLSGAYGIGLPGPDYNAINNAASAAAAAASAQLAPARQIEQPDDVDVIVEIIIIENTEYAIDENGDVFDSDTCEHVGIYNRQSRNWVSRSRPPTGPVANYGVGSPVQHPM